MAEILLVTGTRAVSDPPTAGDQALETILENAGHNVTYQFDGANPPDPASYDAAVLSESCSSSTLSDKYETLELPCVVLEVGVWSDMDLASVDAGSSASTDSFNLDPHAITSGFSFTTQVKNSASSAYGVGEGQVAPGADIFAYNYEAVFVVTGFAIEAGAELISGGAAPARRVALGYIDSWPADLTADGEQLLLNAVDWSLSGGPHEGTFAGTYDFNASFEGSTTLTGEFEGSYGFAGSFEGFGPNVPVHDGLFTATWGFAGTFTGEKPEVLFRFAMPSYEEPIRYYNSPIYRYFRNSVADSLVRVNGTFRQIRTPAHEQLIAAGDEGVDWFLGGYVYTIPEDVAFELMDAGYDVEALSI